MSQPNKTQPPLTKGKEKASKTDQVLEGKIGTYTLWIVTVAYLHALQSQQLRQQMPTSRGPKTEMSL